MTQISKDNTQTSNAVHIPQTYLVIADVVQFIAIGVMLDYLLFGGIDIHWLLRCSTVGVIFFAVVRAHAWVALIAIQLSFLLREPGRSELSVGIESFFMCLSALLIVAYACSWPMARDHLRLWLAGGLHALSGGATNTSTAVAGDQASTVRSLGPGKSLAQQVLWHSAVALVAMLVFVQLPISRAGRDQWWQRSVDARFTLWPGPVALTIAVALMIIVWQSEWRQLTPAQARLVLRSIFLRSHYRDLKMIIQRRLKTSTKLATKMTASSAPTGPTVPSTLGGPIRNDLRPSQHKTSR